MFVNCSVLPMILKRQSVPCGCYILRYNPLAIYLDVRLIRAGQLCHNRHIPTLVKQACYVGMIGLNHALMTIKYR